MSGTPDNQTLESARNASQHTGTEIRCSRCKEVKTTDNFYVDARKNRGFYSACRNCHNSAQILKRSIDAVSRPAKVKKPHSRKNWKQLWRKNNPEKSRESARRSAKRLRATPRGKLNSNISFAVYLSLHGSKDSARWEELVGYTVDQLKKHLEKRFKPGMSWENYGEWHVDHKIPVSVFNFETPEDTDFKRCWNLKNLQPMWAKENQRKSAKLDRPFQPSLTI